LNTNSNFIQASPSADGAIRNVVTLKWGKLYGPDYVNRLASSVRRHTTGAVNIVCFTDDPSGIDPSVQIFPIPHIDLPPGPMVTGWRKLCLFRPDLPIKGECLFLDLDIVITGSLDAFFSYAPGRIPIIHNWANLRKTLLGKRPEIGNSSVFRFTANECSFVWDQFHSEKEWALANFRPPQSYLTHCIRPKMIYWPEQWVRSFKRHCRPFFPFNLFVVPRLPVNCSIVAFHGRPNPDEALVGFKGRRIHHYCRPTPWIADHWH
jgi:hypothetical protein